MSLILAGSISLDSAFNDFHKLFRKKTSTSVPDSWHFGVDPDPRIHASD